MASEPPPEPSLIWVSRVITEGRPFFRSQTMAHLQHFSPSDEVFSRASGGFSSKWICLVRKM
jgi:hypothetical protein